MAEQNPTNSSAAPEQYAGKTTILVVEDDLFLRNLLIKKLLNEGYNVLDAVDAMVALKILETNKPHMILLDLLLPGIDGFELLGRIKKNDTLREVPVIILSNLGSQEDINRALRLGASDYIIKANFTLEEIVERIKKILREKYFDIK